MVGGNRHSICRCGTIALVAKRQTQPPQKRPPTRHGGSSPPGCTIFACARPPRPPVRDARFAKRPRHLSYTPDIPRFKSWSEHQPHSPVAQRQSARLITGRPRIVTVRENQQQETKMTMTMTKPGRLTAAPPSAMDPERSSPRWLGNGLLIRAPRGSTPPGSPNRTITTHD